MKNSRARILALENIFGVCYDKIDEKESPRRLWFVKGRIEYGSVTRSEKKIGHSGDRELCEKAQTVVSAVAA